MRKLRVGDKILCHTTGRMSAGRELFALKGRYYTVVGVKSRNILIESEYRDNHSWTYANEHTSFKNYFEVRTKWVKYSMKKHEMEKC